LLRWSCSIISSNANHLIGNRTKTSIWKNLPAGGINSSLNFLEKPVTLSNVTVFKYLNRVSFDMAQLLQLQIYEISNKGGSETVLHADVPLLTKILNANEIY